MIAYKLCHFSWLPCIVNPVIGTSPLLSLHPPLHSASHPLHLNWINWVKHLHQLDIKSTWILLAFKLFKKPFEPPTQSQFQVIWWQIVLIKNDLGGTVFKAFAGETNIWKCQYKLEQSSLWLQTSLIVNDQIMFTTRAPTGLVTNGCKEVLMPIVSWVARRSCDGWSRSSQGTTTTAPGSGLGAIMQRWVNA